MELIDMIEELANEGQGVCYNMRYDEYHPFSVVDAETLEWWHDPEGCSHVKFDEAVRATHASCFSKTK